MLEIWTDGGCEPNPGEGGYGWTRSDGVEGFGHEDDTTNNRMEMTAVIDALQAVDIQDGPVRIYSDSKYVVDGFNSWMHGWAKKGWVRDRKGSPVKNLDLWKLLYSLNRIYKVELVWVKGHAGNPGNERADELAEIGRFNPHLCSR